MFRTTTQLTGLCLSSEGLNLFYSFSHGAELELSFFANLLHLLKIFFSTWTVLSALPNATPHSRVSTSALSPGILSLRSLCVPQVLPQYVYLSPLYPDWKVFEDRDYKSPLWFLLNMEPSMVLASDLKGTSLRLPFYTALLKFPTHIRSWDKVLVSTQLLGRGHCFRRIFLSFSFYRT